MKNTKTRSGSLEDEMSGKDQMPYKSPHLLKVINPVYFTAFVIMELGNLSFVNKQATGMNTPINLSYQIEIIVSFNKKDASGILQIFWAIVSCKKST